MKFKSGPMKITAIVLLIVLAVVGVCVFFGRILSAVGYVLMLFLPFILGYLLSQLLNPLVSWLESKLKISRRLLAIVVIVLTVGLVGGIITAVIWKIIDEARSVYNQFPTIYENAKSTWELLNQKFANLYNMLPEAAQSVVDNMGNSISESFSDGLNGKYAPVMQTAGNFAKALPNVFVATIVFILSLYFMVTDEKQVSAFLKKVVPVRIQNAVGRVRSEGKRYVGGYVRAQLIIMSISFVELFVGLSILRVDYALLLALGISVLDALPFFGSGAALWPWAIVSMITGDLQRGVGLIIIYLSVILVRQFIEPKIVSSNIGVHPILNLMAMYLGFKLFSIGGMLFGPLVLMLIISFYHAGVFDGIIRLIKAVYHWIRAEFKAFFEVFK